MSLPDKIQTFIDTLRKISYINNAGINRQAVVDELIRLKRNAKAQLDKAEHDKIELAAEKTFQSAIASEFIVIDENQEVINSLNAKILAQITDVARLNAIIANKDADIARLTAEEKKLNRDIRNLQADKAKLEQSVNRLINTIQQKVREINQLKINLKTMEADRNRLAAEKKMLENKYFTLESVKQQLEKDIAAIKAVLQSQPTAQQALQQSQQIQQLSTDLANAQQQAAVDQKNITQLTADLANAQQQANADQKNIAKLTADLANAQQRANADQAEIQKLNAELTTAQQQANADQAEIQKLNAELTAAQQQGQPAQQPAQQPVQQPVQQPAQQGQAAGITQDVYDALLKEKQDLETLYNEVVAKEQKLSTEKQALDNALQQLQADAQLQSTAINNLTNENNNLKSQLQQELAEKKQLEEEKKNLLEKMQELEKAKQDLENKLTEQIKITADHAEYIKKLNRDIGRFLVGQTADYETKEFLVSVLPILQELEQAKIAGTITSAKNLEETIKGMIKQLENKGILSGIANLWRGNSAQTALQQQLTALQKQLTALQQQLANEQKQNSQKIQDLENKVREQLQTITDFQRETGVQLPNELKKLLTFNQAQMDLNQLIKQYEAAMSKISTLDAANAEQQNKIGELRNKLTEAQINIQKLEDEKTNSAQPLQGVSKNVQLREKIEGLKQKLSEAEKVSKENEEKLQNKISQLDNEKQDLESKYEEKILELEQQIDTSEGKAKLELQALEEQLQKAKENVNKQVETRLATHKQWNDKMYAELEQTKQTLEETETKLEGYKQQNMILLKSKKELEQNLKQVQVLEQKNLAAIQEKLKEVKGQTFGIDVKEIVEKLVNLYNDAIANRNVVVNDGAAGLNQLTEEYDQLQNDYNVALLENRKLKEELATVTSELEHNKLIHDELKNEKEQLERMNEQLQKENEKQAIEILELKAEIERLKNIDAKLEELTKNPPNNNQAVEQQLKSVVNTIKDIAKIKEDKNEFIASLQRLRNHLDSNIYTLITEQSEKDELARIKRTLEILIQQSGRYTLDVGDVVRVTENKAETLLSSQEQKIQEFNSAIEEALNFIRKTDSKLQTTEGKAREFEKQQDEYIKLLKGTLKNMLSFVNHKWEAVDQLQGMIKGLMKTKLVNFIQDITELDNRIKTVDNIESFKSVRKEIIDLDKKVSEALDSLNVTLIEEVRKLQTETEKQKRKIDAQKTTIENFEKELKETNEKLKSLTTISEEEKKTQLKEIAKLQSKIDQYNDTLDLALKHIDPLRLTSVEGKMDIGTFEEVLKGIRRISGAGENISSGPIIGGADEIHKPAYMKPVQQATGLSSIFAAFGIIYVFGYALIIIAAVLLLWWIYKRLTQNEICYSPYSYYELDKPYGYEFV